MDPHTKEWTDGIIPSTFYSTLTSFFLFHLLMFLHVFVRLLLPCGVLSLRPPFCPATLPIVGFQWDSQEAENLFSVIL